MTAYQMKPAPIARRPLVGIAVSVIPSMALVMAGQFVLAAYVFFGILTVVLGLNLLNGRYLDATAVAIGTIPVLMLLRGLVLYNSIQVILAVCLAGMFMIPEDRQRFQRNTPLVGLMWVCMLYWFTSVILSGDYSSNIRILEFALTAACVFMLAGHRSAAAAALMGVVGSGVIMAASLLPHGTRLGIVTISSGLSVGNPIAMGLSATLGYLLTIADRGRWLLLHNRPGWRIALNLLAGAALVLSTSRGSWLVTILGVAIIAAMSPTGRKTLGASLALLGVLLVIILQTDRGPMIEHYFDNAVGGDVSLEKRTTGRANQWESFPALFNDSPLWGFGPGSGKTVSLKYTKEGKPWHSLYLLIGAETGLIGLSALALLLFTLAHRGLVHRRTCFEAVPFMCLCCFMVIGISVSGVDSISGVFLGLAFAARDFSPMRVMRTARVQIDSASAAA